MHVERDTERSSSSFASILLTSLAMISSIIICFHFKHFQGVSAISSRPNSTH
ncbi:hypothetical protein BDQ12DRAFT_294518 [Crucibulum laeve]|uniref:Uncharacterized protein n=1 Tax=Crucibulum laeve TaxID=68775 RepID=A0A5C3MBL5_9AGAR|nr:hypothetical protein BDQ12DRAFT_294518 [Crucibulum laeve]